MDGNYLDRDMALLTCMDPRIQLTHSTRSLTGSAFVLRNAGGRLTDDVMRGLIICTRVIDLKEVGILRHTDCRLSSFTNEELADKTGLAMDYMPFSDLAASVVADVSYLRSCGLFGGDTVIWGGIYDVESRTTEVLLLEPPTRAEPAV